MFRQRPLLILALALASAIVAGFAAVRYSEQQPGPAIARDDASVQVVVAARDLPVGHMLAEADLQTVSWPGRTLPAGYVSQASAAVGRGLITTVRMNAPILEADLAERGSGAGMPIIFPEGMRAVSVRVDDVISVAGYATPRTRVDVLLTMRIPNSEQTFTQTILQNLVVLGAGQTVQQNERGEPITYSVATLMVTPEQAEKLVLAASQGRIQLALRNMLDIDEANTTGIPDTRLFEMNRQPARTAGGAPAPRPRTRQPDENVIEVFRGGVRSLQRF
jgi:pilus assembly protein CpaB